MTRQGPRRPVSETWWRARLDTARAYRRAAEDKLVLVEPGQACNPIVSDMVLAAIAYGDCLTAQRARVVNRQDHAAAVRLLREVLGNRLPAEQERRFRRLLGMKDEAHYGARSIPRAEAQGLAEVLAGFADWVEDSLRA